MTDQEARFDIAQVLCLDCADKRGDDGWEATGSNGNETCADCCYPFDPAEECVKRLPDPLNVRIERAWGVSYG